MGRILGVPQLEPLENDEEIHVPEEKTEEEHLRYELKPDLKFPFEVERVEQFEEDSADHVQNGNYDRYLHFQTVDEDKVITRHAPNGIDPERIYAIFSVSIGQLSVPLNVEGVAGAKQVDIHAQKIIVDPSAVESEETHHQHHVSQLADKRQRTARERRIIEDQIEPQEEKNEPVAHVAEHDSEEEGESDCGEYGRIDF